MEQIFDELVAFAMHDTKENQKSETYAAALTCSGKILFSKSFPARLDAACLCAETGCMIQAVNLKEVVARSICIRRNNKDNSWEIMPACGLCRERLWLFGSKTLIAVPHTTEGTIAWKTLSELSPDSWGGTDA